MISIMSGNIMGYIRGSPRVYLALKLGGSYWDRDRYLINMTLPLYGRLYNARAGQLGNPKPFLGLNY